MISREEIKSQFDSVSEQLKGQISTLPESTSLLINFLVATFNMSFELSSNQNDNLQASIDSLKQTMKQQTQTIEQQTKKIQELLDKLEQKNQENLKFQQLIKTLKTLLKSKDVDLDALKRLLFQGGREQEEEQASQNKTEKPKNNRKNSKTRERESNSSKLQNCDIEQSCFLDVNGKPLNALTKEEASTEVPKLIERDGKQLEFKCWKESSSKIQTCTTRIKSLTFVPVYEEVRGTELLSESDRVSAKSSKVTIIGLNPEEGFLPKTVIGFDLMSEMIEDRMKNRIPMNRIAQSVSEACGFGLTRQQLAKYFVKSSEWIAPAYEYLINRVLDSRIIHLDETFVHCQAEKNNRQYMIVFTSETGCFYHYANTRSQTVPFAILQNHFDGKKWVDNDGNTVVISTDGWYDVEWLKDSEGNVSAVLVGCMVHLRRYFWDVYDVHKNHKDEDSEDYKISERIINLLKFIFHRDKECKTSEERTKIRKAGEVREKFNETLGGTIVSTNNKPQMG